MSDELERFVQKRLDNTEEIDARLDELAARLSDADRERIDGELQDLIDGRPVE